jgi:hypothetical protein
MSDIDLLKPNSLIVDLGSQVSPIILSNILGCNVSLLYQHSQMGRLPPDLTGSTYLECIQTYLNYYKKATDLKLAKEANEQELRRAKLAEDTRIKEEKIRLKEEQDRAKAESKTRRTFSSLEDGEEGSNDGMPPLVAAKMKQDIRLGIAKELQLYQRIAIERNDYVSVKEIIPLLEPFLQAIKNNLVDLSADNPEIQEKIDQNLESLYNLGVAMIEKADLDSDRYVQYILDKELDIKDIEINLTR